MSLRDCEDMVLRLAGDRHEHGDPQIEQLALNWFDSMTIGMLHDALVKRLEQEAPIAGTFWLLDFVGGWIADNRTERPGEIADLAKLPKVDAKFAGGSDDHAQQYNDRIEWVNHTIKSAGWLLRRS